MDDLSLAFGAATVLELGGESYRFAKYRAQDLSDLIGAAQGAKMTRALEAIQKLPPNFREKAAERAVMEAMNGEEPNLKQFVSTLPGQAYALWLSLRREHPELKPRDVEALIRDLPSLFVINLITDRMGVSDAKKSLASDGETSETTSSSMPSYSPS